MAMRRPVLTDGPVPFYVQLADHVEAELAAGRIARGDKLPSERDLAEDWVVAYQTVRHAMAVLRERGVVVSSQGRGTYLA